MRRFIVVVDTQADFMHGDGALAVDGAEALIGPMQEWLVALDFAEVAGVLFTFDTHLAETFAGSAEAEQFPIHCVRGTPGWQNVLDANAVAPGIATYRVSQQPFQPRILVLKHLQLARLRHVHAAVRRLPFVKRRAAYTVLPAHVCRRRASLLLAQDPDDLLFRKPAALHLRPP